MSDPTNADVLNGLSADWRAAQEDAAHPAPPPAPELMAAEPEPADDAPMPEEPPAKTKPARVTRTTAKAGQDRSKS